jgi:hypothetical protein
MIITPSYGSTFENYHMPNTNNMRFDLRLLRDLSPNNSLLSLLFCTLSRYNWYAINIQHSQSRYGAAASNCDCHLHYRVQTTASKYRHLHSDVNKIMNRTTDGHDETKERVSQLSQTPHTYSIALYVIPNAW